MADCEVPVKYVLDNWQPSAEKEQIIPDMTNQSVYTGPVNYYSLCKHVLDEINFLDGDGDGETDETLKGKYDPSQPLSAEATLAYQLLIFGYVRMIKLTDNISMIIPNEIHPIIMKYTRIEPEMLDINIGDTIKTRFGRIAIIKFIGQVHFWQYDLIGIETEKWEPDGHNGIVHGHKYFECIDGRGLFIRPYDVVEIVQTAASDVERQEFIKSKKEEMFPILKIRKKLYRRRELDSKKQELKWALVVSYIIRNLESEYNEIHVPKEINNMIFQFVIFKPLTELPSIGDRVRTKKGKTGIVKFIGKTDFSREAVIGLDLDLWISSGHDGTVRGYRYFNCQPGHGYFTKLHRLVANDGRVDRNDDKNNIDYDEINYNQSAMEIKSKLRRIRMLEFKLSNEVKLNKTERDLIDSKQSLLKELNDLNSWHQK